MKFYNREKELTLLEKVCCANLANKGKKRNKRLKAFEEEYSEFVGKIDTIHTDIKKIKDNNPQKTDEPALTRFAEFLSRLSQRYMRLGTQNTVLSTGKRCYSSSVRSLWHGWKNPDSQQTNRLGTTSYKQI